MTNITENQVERIIKDLVNTDKKFSVIAKENNVTKQNVSYWKKRLERDGVVLPKRTKGVNVLKIINKND